MTEVTITRTAHRQAGRGSTRTRINAALAVALMAAVALAPLPLGSVRPTFWAIWSSYIGLVGVVYFAALVWGGNRLRIPPRKVWPAALLSGLTCAFLVIQLLPFNFDLSTLGGSKVMTDQISIAPNMTVLMLMRQLTYLLFAALFLQVCFNDGRRTRILLALTILVAAYGVYGIYALQAGDTILGMPKWAYLGSATGPFVNRNSFATFLGLGAVIPLASACTLVVRQSQRHAHDGNIRNLGSGIILNGLIYLFLLSAVVATASRMGLFATIAGSTVVFIAMLTRVGRVRLALLVVPALLVLLALAVMLYGQGLIERIGPDDASADSRAALYSQVIDLIALRPWTGFGGGSFELAFPLVHQPALSPDYGWSKAHSTYLTLWSELGVVFGTLPVLVMVYFGWRLISGLRTKDGSWTAQTIGLGALTVGGVHSLADFSLEIPAVTFLFLALVAQGVATTVTADQDRGTR